MKSSMETLLPSRATPKVDIVDPRRRKLRKDSVEPICTKLRTLREDPSLAMPNALRAEPRRTKLRRLVVEPMETKLRTLKLEPRRAIP